jgi:deoxyribodipyrimidine photolyase-related protein
MKTILIFPVNLFEKNDLLEDSEPNTKKIIIEDPVYFTKYDTHKLKLILHRASMKKYADDHKLEYIEFHKADDFYKNNTSNITCYDPVDHDIINTLKKYAKKNKFELDIYETPAFISTYDDLEDFHNKNKDKRFIHDSQFYRWQRERLQILNNSKKLSYDDENRKPFPKNQKDVFNPVSDNNKYVKEAIKYVEKHFYKNFGSSENFFYPIDHEEAKKWLHNFINHRFKLFGDYEDAIGKNVKFGFHSVLSPLLNIGLLTDQNVLDKILPYEHKIPINAFEGFIRQIIGWKSTMRYFYEFYYEKQFGKNNLKHNRKLTDHFWKGTTQIPIIDDSIKKLHSTGYLHHIERLMVMGNFMLLCEIDPNEVFKWFMLTIDAYQWVMVPNIFGMSQYADGGLLMTRPYFSSSNYIKKMSDYKTIHATIELKPKSNKKYTWEQIWDALYYRFIYKNREMLKKIYATARNVAHWDKKPKEDQDNLLEVAELYLKFLDL